MDENSYIRNAYSEPKNYLILFKNQLFRVIKSLNRLAPHLLIQ